MINKRLSKVLLLLCLGQLSAAYADDIDIFVGSSGGTSDAPRVMILLDNSPNWSKASQQWPDAPTQGNAELNAIQSVLGQISATTPIQVGLAMLNAYTPPGGNGTGGGYVRFAARDMTVATNRQALQNIVAGINVNSPMEKVAGQAHKDEAAGFYELYKYYSGMAPYFGVIAQNINADYVGNINPPVANDSNLTGAGQGLLTGFAFQLNGNYQSPVTGCSKNYIIYIANNSNGAFNVAQTNYEPSGLSVGANTLAAWTSNFFGSSSVPITTYVLDAFHAQQNAQYSAYLHAAATQGGGAYYQVGSQAAIITALQNVLAEIQAVNSTFASTSLPVSASNRSQDQNEVFIGMFRPDANAKPRWYGNLKRYQLIIDSLGNVGLGDVNGNSAVNSQTGFVTNCATSFWTTDTGNYWQSVPNNPPSAGTCPSTTFNAFSDAPDGPLVEKGAVAEVIRQGNNPPTTSTAPTWAVNRTMYTLSANNLVTFNVANTGLPANVVAFTQGHDVNDENGNGNTVETRPSLHGDVVHSRALPLDYGGSTGVVAFYGANDGTLRAVNAANGQELWSFVAPEFYSRLSRLMINSPLIAYPNMPAGFIPLPTPKDYFFDGSIGAYESADLSKVWIYPAMRRGGRKIYAFDVTNVSSPQYKWSVGCPDLGDDLNCAPGGFAGIGQTWSTPEVAFIKGYSATNPVVIVGGGYDSCEDANTATPVCVSPKGAAVYILDANTGALVASFATLRSVVADVALVDIDADGGVDYAYVADTGGNIYRISFIDGPTTHNDLTAGQWVMNRVAYTNGSGRKFEFAPALAYNSQKVYLALGSGDREHPLYTEYPYQTPVLNRFYVYLDDLNATTGINLDDTTKMADYSGTTGCGTTSILPSSTLKGWFMNLNQYGQGEQTIGSALIAGGLVTFSTNRPIPPAQGTCSTTLGEARGYWLNLLNASGAVGPSLAACGLSRSSIYTGGGLVPSPVWGTVSISGSPKSVIIGAIQRSGAVSSPISAQQATLPLKSSRSRVYWHSKTDAN